MKRRRRKMHPPLKRRRTMHPLKKIRPPLKNLLLKINKRPLKPQPTKSQLKIIKTRNNRIKNNINNSNSTKLLLKIMALLNQRKKIEKSADSCYTYDALGRGGYRLPTNECLILNISIFKIIAYIFLYSAPRLLFIYIKLE
jgi:hypothetical protein